MKRTKAQLDSDKAYLITLLENGFSLQDSENSENGEQVKVPFSADTRKVFQGWLEEIERKIN